MKKHRAVLLLCISLAAGGIWTAGEEMVPSFYRDSVMAMRIRNQAGEDADSDQAVKSGEDVDSGREDAGEGRSGMMKVSVKKKIISSGWNST